MWFVVHVEDVQSCAVVIDSSFPMALGVGTVLGSHCPTRQEMPMHTEYVMLGALVFVTNEFGALEKEQKGRD